MTPEQAKQSAADLAGAVFRVGLVWARLGVSRDVSPEVRARATSLFKATVDLQQDVWDLHPETVSEDRLPTMEFDLLPIVEAMRGHPQPTREDPIRQLLTHAPPAVAYAAEHAESEEATMDLLEDWARSAAPSVVAMNHIARELSAERRWRRVVAARTLESLGVTGLLDPATGDVDQEAATQWRALR